jgi:phosphotriesterase-related protein
MDTVNTTNGKLKVDDLGRTLIHEHVTVGFPGWYLDVRQPKFKRDEAAARVVDMF